MTRGEATQLRAANVAAGLAFASAATTAYWLLGGTALLDTVGGYPDELARSRRALALVVGVLVVGAKVVVGLLALSLAGPVVRFLRLLLLTGSAGALLLSVYGGLLVVVGALVRSDVIRPDGPVDRWTGGPQRADLARRPVGLLVPRLERRTGPRELDVQQDRPWPRTELGCRQGHPRHPSG